MNNLHVLIAGGGIGGLCLAHGLRQAGISVTVYERTLARTDWLQGYRIHINPNGSAALHDCLPAQNWQAFLDTVCDTANGFAFVTEQLRDLLVLGPDFVDPAQRDPAHQHHGVSRIILRQVLLAGLDVVEFGKTFERYELIPDGRVTAHFSDGSSATGDLLVGADGANSRVRAQLLPHAAERLDTGVIAIAGKHWLAGDHSHRLPPQLTDRVNSVIPAGRGSLFTAVWAGAGRAQPALVRPDSAPIALPLEDSRPYTFWGYADSATRFPPAPPGAEPAGADLQRVVLDKIPGWHPALRELIAGSDPDTVNLVRIRSAKPVQPWPTGPVTLLGDAIHNMTPMGGIGANTALRDADLLRRELVAVQRGEQALRPAVNRYEREMLDYGFAAVRRSLRNARMAASANPLGRRAFQAVLRTASAVPALKRAMFGGIGE